jgi:hypothetical protein
MTDKRSNTSAALVLALLASALLPQGADAQRDRSSANYFVPVCQRYLAAVTGAPQEAPQDDSRLIWFFQQGECRGNIQALAFASDGMSLAEFRSCIPKGATDGQMVRVALAYIERRPQRMHEEFRGLVLEAWHEAWPCKDGQ